MEELLQIIGAKEVRLLKLQVQLAEKDAEIARLVALVPADVEARCA